MPITLTGGNFRNPDNTTITGILSLKLSGDAHIVAGGQTAPSNINITITAGNVAGTPSILGNDELSPSGTFYYARLLDSSGNQVYGPENWQLTGGGTLDIGTVNPTTTTPTLVVNTASLSELDVTTLKLDATAKDVVFTRASANRLNINASNGVVLNGTNPTITTPAGGAFSATVANPASGAGGGVTLSAASGVGSGAGGAVNISCGNSSGTTNPGGVMNLSSGNGGSTSGAGGDINITSGSCTGTARAGNINISGGPSTSGIGGTIVIQPGTGSPDGTISLKSATTGTPWKATLKKGSGGGNYDSASTSYVRADTTNLVYATVVPTGWNLYCTVTGSATTLTAAVAWNIALADSTADNTGILAEVQGTSAGAAVASPFAVSTIVAGDGNTHTINVQFKTSNGADHVNIANGNSTIAPMLSILLLPF